MTGNVNMCDSVHENENEHKSIHGNVRESAHGNVNKHKSNEGTENEQGGSGGECVQ